MISRRALLQLTSSASVLTLTSCGVLLYPERQGQKQGRIDPLVAVLDGIGLFFFVIPGLVAFAIDFYQGTIYLPGGRRASLNDSNSKNFRSVKIEGPRTQANIEAILTRELNTPIHFAEPTVRATRIEPHQLSWLQFYTPFSEYQQV
jgi:hypothetical protein